MKFKDISMFGYKEPLLYKEHMEVLKTLQGFTKEELASSYKIKGDLLDKTYEHIINYNQLKRYQAFPSFTGLVYKQLSIDSYDMNDIEYVNKHVRILDAFYGVLEPSTLITPYRLDMKTNIGLNLYKHYDLSPLFENELIINLASNEFSKMITLPMISIHFREQKGEVYKNLATYSKMARGMFLEFMIKNKVTNIEEIKRISLEGYSYNDALSDSSNLFFTRNS